MVAVEAEPPFAKILFERSVRIGVIGASAGGVDAILELARDFPRGCAFPWVIVLHLPPDAENRVPELLEGRGGWLPKEAESTEGLEPGWVYVAPPGYHLSVEANGTFSISNEEAVHFSRPSIDVLFESVAHAYGGSAIGVLLTGASDDGARGLHKIHDHGGITIVEDPRTAAVSVMPQAAIQRFRPDYVAPIPQIRALLHQFARIPRVESDAESSKTGAGGRGRAGNDGKGVGR